MTKELDTKLLEMLNQTTDLLQDGATFATAQIPDVIEQLLSWYLVYNFIKFMLGIFIIIAQIYGSYYWVFKIEPKIKAAHRYIATIFGVGIGGLFLFLLNITILLNLTWLKIWIAPKLFLIEYTASLIK